MTVQRLIKYAGYELKLEVTTGADGLNRQIKTAESNRPGLALCGYYEHFGYDRVQIFGHGEIGYLESLSPPNRSEVLIKLLSYAIPCIVVTGNLTPSAETHHHWQTEPHSDFNHPPHLSCFHDTPPPLL